MKTVRNLRVYRLTLGSRSRWLRVIPFSSVISVTSDRSSSSYSFRLMSCVNLKSGSTPTYTVTHTTSFLHYETIARQSQRGQGSPDDQITSGILQCYIYTHKHWFPCFMGTSYSFILYKLYILIPHTN